MRSKSEAMIDMVLRIRKIPFRYKCLLELGGISFYPDFTIRHPVTAAVFYWEHFGIVDDPKYCQKAYSKLYTYFSYGIIPSINLIITYETREKLVKKAWWRGRDGSKGRQNGTNNKKVLAHS